MSNNGTVITHIDMFLNKYIIGIQIDAYKYVYYDYYLESMYTDDDEFGIVCNTEKFKDKNPFQNSIIDEICNRYNCIYKTMTHERGSTIIIFSLPTNIPHFSSDDFNYQIQNTCDILKQFATSECNKLLQQKIFKKVIVNDEKKSLDPNV
jgi:hypothetical protein